MDEWPILEEGETYVPPNIATALMYIESGVARFHPGAIACMKSLSQKTLEFDPAGDAETVRVDEEGYADILRGSAMDVTGPNEPDEQILKSIVIHSDDDDTREFLLDLMVKCASRQESLKQELAPAAKKMQKKWTVTQASLLGKRKKLPPDVGPRIGSFAAGKRKKTRKVTKKKSRKTRRR